MKKRSKNESSQAPAQGAPDVAAMISRIQQQLVSVERKIDDLVSRAARPGTEQRYPTNLFRPLSGPQRNDSPHQQQQDNRPRERTMYKAICADCNKGCEVPFQPSQDRPVYCKECYSKRRNKGSFRPAVMNSPGKPSAAAPGRHEKHHSAAEHKPPVEKKAAEKKKRPAAKPKKKRS